MKKIISVILAVIGYFVLPYQKSSKNEKEIIRINERIKESIKPSIDRNSYNIEKNAAEIKSNYEKISGKPRRFQLTCRLCRIYE